MEASALTPAAAADRRRRLRRERRGRLPRAVEPAMTHPTERTTHAAHDHIH